MVYILSEGLNMHNTFLQYAMLINGEELMAEVK